MTKFGGGGGLALTLSQQGVKGFKKYYNRCLKYRKINSTHLLSTYNNRALKLDN